MQRANVEELCEDPREAGGALVRSVPFLHGRDLPDPEERWWGGFVEAQMREKEVPLPERQVDLSPLQAACKGKKTETGDTTSGMTRSTTLQNRRPVQTGDQGTCLAQLFVKCPFFCKQEVTVEAVKLAKRGEGRAVWSCSNCRQLKKKQVRVNWSQLVCVQCTNASRKECSLKSCRSDCPTKQALGKKKML